jgi:hypothetical protein
MTFSPTQMRRPNYVRLPAVYETKHEEVPIEMEYAPPRRRCETDECGTVLRAGNRGKFCARCMSRHARQQVAMDGYAGRSEKEIRGRY